MTNLCLTINAAAKPIELGEISLSPNQAINIGAFGVGIKGADGLSAYEIAVKNGFKGTEQEWLNTLGGYYTLPVASQAELGGIKVGETLIIDNAVLAVDPDLVEELDSTALTNFDIHEIMKR